MQDGDVREENFLVLGQSGFVKLATTCGDCDLRMGEENLTDVKDKCGDSTVLLEARPYREGLLARFSMWILLVLSQRVWVPGWRADP